MVLFGKRRVQLKKCVDICLAVSVDTVEESAVGSVSYPASLSRAPQRSP